MLLTTEGELRVRKTVSTDCNAIYRWRNHPDTRRYFFDPSPIDLETHTHWFTETLKDPHRYLLIAENHHHEPIGIMRFDASKHEDVASVDIYLVPEKRGFRLGKPMLLAGLSWLKSHTSIRRVTANVLSANESSCRMFDSAGFVLASHTYGLDLGRTKT